MATNNQQRPQDGVSTAPIERAQTLIFVSPPSQRGEVQVTETADERLRRLVGDDWGGLPEDLLAARLAICRKHLNMFEKCPETIQIPPSFNHYLQELREGTITEAEIPPNVMGVVIVPAHLQWCDHAPHMFTDIHMMRLANYIGVQSESYQNHIITMNANFGFVQFVCDKTALKDRFNSSSDISQCIVLEVERFHGSGSILKLSGVILNIAESGDIKTIMFKIDGKSMMGTTKYRDGKPVDKYKEYPNGDVLITKLKADGSIGTLQRYARLGTSWNYVPLKRTTRSNGQSYDYVVMGEEDPMYAHQQHFEAVAHLVNPRDYDSHEELNQALLAARV